MSELPDAYRDAVRFSFGDSAALADELLALVLAGVKTATCAPLRNFGPGREPMPRVGRIDVVLDGSGRPACAIETLAVEVRRFDEVDEDFALAEGEGTFDEWRSGHEVYFDRNGGFSPDMEVVCERFRVVEVFPRT